MNNVNLIGRLTKDVELRTLENGTEVTTVTLAVDKGLSKEKRAEFASKDMATADFIPVVVWGAMAKNLATYKKKGDQLAVIGQMQSRSYVDKEGITRYVIEVRADQINFL